MVNTFKKQPSAGADPGLRRARRPLPRRPDPILDDLYPGVGLQAVIGTLSVFAVTLVLFKSGKVRATPKAMRFFMIAMIGYAVFALINMVMMWTGAVNSPFGLRTSMEIFGIPLGVFIGLLAIGLAAFSLIMDFTSIEAGVRSRRPAALLLDRGLRPDGHARLAVRGDHPPAGHPARRRLDHRSPT